MSGFVPDDFELKDPTIPWFEDASAALGVKGHKTSKTIDQLKLEIRAAFSSLGAGVTAFKQGHFDKVGNEKFRYAYQIEFTYGDRDARMIIAALPIRNETASKKEQALKQVLFTVREMLESQFNSGLLIPGSAPLVQYMLDDHGRTLAEALSEQSSVPLLSPPIRGKQTDDEISDDDDDVFEGEFEVADNE